MKKLHVAVTSGNTCEKIDDVRVMSNISSGKLGARIADEFLLAGHEVTYIAPKRTVEPREDDYNRWIVSNVETLMNAMQLIVPKVDAVIHPIAVSDFTFNYKGSVKCDSDSAEDFIEHMRKTIVPTPKVIAQFRMLNPRAVLVRFKFTSGKSAQELKEIALKLKETNGIDMVFANDKMAMAKAGSHNGVLYMDDWEEKCYGKNDIATNIFTNVIRLAGTRGLK